MGCGMVNIDDEIDPLKVRTGLFAIITARTEDANMLAVRGQSRGLNTADARNYITDIQSILDEIQIQLDAAELIE